MDILSPWLCTPNTKNAKLKCKKKKCFLCDIRTTNLFFLLIILGAKEVHCSSVVATPSQKAAEKALEQNSLLADDFENEKLIGDNFKYNQPHSRRKRLIWITDDGRLALPPGTSLTFTPTIALPLVRHPPEGFFSNMSISFPVTIDFDKLGLTDNQNPLGDLPPLLARSFGNAAGNMIGKYVANYLHYKRKRDIQDMNEATPENDETLTSKTAYHVKHEPISQSSVDLPKLPERFQHIFHGGERVMLYIAVEDFLSNFGLDGKACLLRTICEIHFRGLQHFGVFGEMIKLFLTVTESPFADLIPEYVLAQEIGEGKKAPGECFPYFKKCPKGIFKTNQNHKYSKQRFREHDKDLGKYAKTLKSVLEDFKIKSYDVSEMEENDVYASFLM